ncbi:NAD-glutamate dehydrogenase [Brevibacterium sp. 5221]|uniref:NAD-glutamate dehydrogenase n=1 Tax=Brevibacterium rongguiense TaxID=2695267 RepID=A0A6N9H6V1_9MICO|nr:NAD-glutamate dehydrogenase [Brevibacterium rongguiense]MYM19635.1 NAD-glutamate dehydrogenase [Brevibacterium rongguiense]
MTEVYATEIARAWTELTGQIPPTGLLSSYFFRIDRGEYSAQGPRAMAERARRHFELAERFTGDRPAIELRNPEPGDADYSGNRTVIAIVVRDMRYLLSSLVADLTGDGYAIRAVHHPQPVTERAGGHLTIVDPDDVERMSTATSALPVIRPGMSNTARRIESWIRIEIDQVPAERFSELAEELERIITVVAAAEDDRDAMAGKAEEIAAELRAHAPSAELADEAAVAADLLDWLDGRFAFMGYREYTLGEDSAGNTTLEPVPDTALGISTLRETTSSPLSRAVAAHTLDRHVLVLTKANSRSQLVRRGYMDYLGVKTFDAEGNIVGERRFVGLYTSGMYNASVLDIPVIKQKVSWVLRNSGLARDSYSGNELLDVLETYPRDDLFHADPQDILDVALAVIDLQEKRESSVFIRRDAYERYVSVLVYVPRDLYDTASRMRVEKVLREFYRAESVDFDVLLTDSALARLHFVVRAARDELLPDIAPDRVAGRIRSAVRSWHEDVREYLAPSDTKLTSRALERAHLWAASFPPSYLEHNTPHDAVADVARFESLASDAQPLVRVHREFGTDERRLRLAFYRLEPAGLTQVLPYLSNLGAQLLDERSYELTLADGSHRYIYDFGLEFEAEVPETEFERIEEAFVAGWLGKRESGRMDRLIVSGLRWQDVSILRAFTHYLRQAGFSYSDPYMGQVFTSNPEISALLVGYFNAKFDPELLPVAGTRAEHIDKIRERIQDELSGVSSLDADRVLRAVLDLITAMVRTNVFQPADGSLPEASVFKIHPNELDFVPKPKPALEMWVYSPEVSGVHLRFGPVARGGLRWSDRRDDFRTEVLGLVKAQMVKNALIVPTGAKGGFFPKRLPDPAVDRQAWAEAGQHAYEVFINGLLDVTDNLVPTAEGTQTVHPERTVIHDGDDSYLVVAADKGTAKFSDVANGIAERRGFWLGDAFASGGSVGYDHKAMAITSRGAWKSVERHFRELGVNTDAEDFTAVGIGDMSGDVFGNGMQRSAHTKLIAAFDHRDIFIDPNPDPQASFAERRRLFDVPRSSWQDYDRSLISSGGGVYSRSAKSVVLSAEAAEALGMKPGRVAPGDLIQGILRAPVDLLYNGGIGTYIRAESETDSQVGDKANDAIRITGAEVRARVVGEGGNLGATQLGRVEAALAGVQINTDAVDNSAGVDCSDHEVNIKLLLSGLIDAGEVAAADREEVLLSMTDEVADLVLANNYSQNTALGDAREQSSAMLGTQRRLLRYLERNAGLDRAVEFLPDSKALARRAEAGRGFASPELAVLLAYVKMDAVQRILASEVPDEPFMRAHLRAYFPAALGGYGEALERHPLHREIATARLVNRMVDRGGLTYVFRLLEEANTSVAQVARAFSVVSAVFDLDEHFDEICALDNVVPAHVQNELINNYVRLLDRGSRWLIHQASDALDVEDGIAAYRPVVAALRESVPGMLRGRDRSDLEDHAAAYVGAGVPQGLAFRAAGLLDEFALLDIAQAAQRTGLEAEDVAEVYYAVTDLLSGAAILDLVGQLDRRSRWTALARGALRDDYYQAVFSIAIAVLRSTESDRPTPAERADDRIAQWRTSNEYALEQVLATIEEVRELDEVDQAPLSVLLRMMRSIVRSTVWQAENS